MQNGMPKGPIAASNHPGGALAAEKNSKKGAGSINAALNLTSMVDIFSMLVVFLLNNFSSSGEIVTPQKDIRLPEVEHSDPLDRATLVKISSNGVYYEDKKTADLAQFKDKSAFSKEDPFLLSELNENLKKAQKAYALIHQDGQNDKNIIFQVDADMPYEVLKAAMYTATVNKYEVFRFAVLPK